MKRIEGFKGEFRFLSNFWPVDVMFDGYKYPSVEHAYQSAKTFNIQQRKVIRGVISPVNAKRLGAAVDKRLDWDDIKLDVMYDLVKQKFTNDLVLRDALLATGDAYIEETNYWHDHFWGVCDGIGHNHLGKILMKVRTELSRHE